MSLETSKLKTQEVDCPFTIKKKLIYIGKYVNTQWEFIDNINNPI